ncbi:Thioredoxin-related transmembrane protein 1 [Trichoplax sp. H2]|nr:Thioredoxin-related transmembrane protein 1 [Trichoplax sp. H2]|eukprot:RDD42631.1 Thioredoxin-related transmembrane protein 1 [Trichoplax sp. H2]
MAIKVATLLAIILLLLGNPVSGQVVKLTGNNWKQALTGEWMIKFYAPWCPACQNLAETWTNFATWAKKQKDHTVSVAEVDVTQDEVTQQDSLIEQVTINRFGLTSEFFLALGAQFMITALPTIFHVKNGQFRKYSPPPTLSNFQAYITNQNWEKADPLSWWKSPSSITMVGLGYLYKFSMQLKSLHQMLVSEYNIPEYVAYGIMGLGFIIVGLVIALLGSSLIDSALGTPSPNRNVQELIDMQQPENDSNTQDPATSEDVQDSNDKDEDKDSTAGTDEGAKVEEDYVIVNKSYTKTEGSPRSSPRRRKLKASAD